MSARRLAAIALAITASLGLVGCGLGQQAAQEAAEQAVENQIGGDVEIGEDGSVKVDGEDGSLEVGTGNLPDGWPADIPPIEGFTVSAGITDASMGASTAAFEAEGDRTADVAAYVAGLEAAGWVSVVPDPAPTGMFGLENGDRFITILVSVEDGKTTAAVTVTTEQP